MTDYSKPRDPEAPTHPAVYYVLTLQHQKRQLREALQALLAVDVKGHTIADRLQFSDSGRAILLQCRSALEATQ